jgi:SAM-dependent methyltransferase
VANVEFHLAKIDQIPLADASADVIVSNCVINLAPDKKAVFREMFRALKAGGRVAVSDIALKKPLPPDLAKDLMAYVGCIAGAVLIDEYRAALEGAGFRNVVVTESGSDLNAYAKVENQSGCCSPPMTQSSEKRPTSLTIADAGGGCCTPSAAVHSSLIDLLSRYDVNDYAASVKVYALKP